MAGAAAWKLAEQTPPTVTSRARIAYRGAIPRRLIAVPEAAGMRMTKYRRLARSARCPMRGCSSEGEECMKARRPACVLERLSLAIRAGKRGARKLPYMSLSM
jgi:hypothetical protein